MWKVEGRNIFFANLRRISIVGARKPRFDRIFSSARWEPVPPRRLLLGFLPSPTRIDRSPLSLSLPLLWTNPHPRARKTVGQWESLPVERTDRWHPTAFYPSRVHVVYIYRAESLISGGAWPTIEIRGRLPRRSPTVVDPVGRITFINFLPPLSLSYSSIARTNNPRARTRSHPFINRCFWEKE